VTDLARYATDSVFTGTGWVVIDFEGTTPMGRPPEPIEVGAVLLRPGAAGMECAGRYEALIQPPAYAPLTAADTRQTGITATMLADRPAAGPVLAGLDALLTEPPYVTVAHHAPTEAGILRRYALVCPTLAATPMLDTLHLAKACHPGLASYGLDALLKHYGIAIPADRHRALADAEATARLLVRLLADGATRHGWSQLAQLRSLGGAPAPAAGSAQAELF
jgi:DNA polymerase-3 subunit epsilon